MSQPQVRLCVFITQFNLFLGTLSSYAYVQMLLFYLQLKRIPILPNLQNVAANKKLVKTSKDFMRVTVL